MFPIPSSERIGWSSSQSWTGKQRTGKQKIRFLDTVIPARKTVEDIHNGTVFVRLQIGVNAIAHTCYDSRTVGKKDDVSFVVTHIDSERNVALGIITRIIRQNL